MLEHATYLESMALRLCHNAVLTISTTLVRTNTAKIIDLLGSTFGVDLTTRNDEDDDEEVESVTSEEEEHLPKMGSTSHVSAQSAQVAKFTQPPDSSSTTIPKQPAPKIKGQSK